MARLRKGVSYRKLERPYTRFSKYKKLNYVRSRPVCKVVRFDMGDPSKQYDYRVDLIAKSTLQIRDNSIESARQTGNRVLELALGKSGYHLQVRMYPHHVLRENPLACGAGADRMSTGMAHSFGKVTGIAAQVKEGKTMFTIKTNKESLPIARKAMRRISSKLPCACSVVEKPLKTK
ncbi:MAG: 50S ribosomal protein L16 [Candidatus Woesearchaeota archaeon]